MKRFAVLTAALLTAVALPCRGAGCGATAVMIDQSGTNSAR